MEKINMSITEFIEKLGKGWNFCRGWASEILSKYVKILFNKYNISEVSLIEINFTSTDNGKDGPGFQYIYKWKIKNSFHLPESKKISLWEKFGKLYNMKWSQFDFEINEKEIIFYYFH